MTKPVRKPEGHGGTDMSPEAIDVRLRELAQLYRLGVSLRGGRWLGPLDESEERRPGP